MTLPVYRTALYIRLSREELEGRDTVKIQTLQLEQFVMKHPDLVLSEEYVDNGVSGTVFDRPAFNRLLEAIRNHEIDCVVVKDLSRLGRDYIEAGRFIEYFCPNYSIRFIAVNDGFDTMNVSDGEMLSTGLRNIINDAYTRDISKKLTSSLQSKRERGESLHPYAPYGYMKDPANRHHLLVDTEVAPIVKRIFDMRTSGFSYARIYRQLNEEGILSPGEYRRACGIITNKNRGENHILWGNHMVKIILHNPVYLGLLAQGKQRSAHYKGQPCAAVPQELWTVVEHTHEPIIDSETFYRVQEIDAETEKAQASQTKAKAPHTNNPYCGKIKCADCGHTMKIVRSLYKDRTRASFLLKCSSYIAHGETVCSAHRIYQADLDAALLQTIQKHIDMLDKRSPTLQPSNDGLTANSRAQIVRALNNATDDSMSIYLDYKAGKVTVEEYKQKKLQSIELVKYLKERLSAYDAAQKTIKENGKKRNTDWTIKTISKEVMMAFIDEVLVHTDGSLNIKLRFNSIS